MLLFANKARAALTNSITAAAGQVATVTTGAGALFVGVGGVATTTTSPMRCVLTAVDTNGNDTGAFEVVEIVGSGDNLTLQARGLEGTTAAAWGAGAVIECRPTADLTTQLLVGLVGIQSYPFGRSGKWYPANPGTRSLINTTDTTYGGDIQNYYITAQPIMFRRDTLCDVIGINVTGAVVAGVKTRLAVYDHDPSRDLPKNLLIDAGEIPCDTGNGFKNATLNFTFKANTRYWIAQQSSGTVNGNGYNTYPGFPAFDFYDISYGANTLPYFVQAAYGAFPADLSALTWGIERAYGIFTIGVRAA